MKKLLLGLSLIAGAAASQAVDVVASYNGDAYVYGVNAQSMSGMVNVRWSGYETPYDGRTAWRVVVWDGGYVVANDLVLASSSDSTYTRNYSVTPGDVVRVELYAAANQYANDQNPSHDVATSMWVTPVNTLASTYYNTWQPNYYWQTPPYVSGNFTYSVPSNIYSMQMP